VCIPRPGYTKAQNSSYLVLLISGRVRQAEEQCREVCDGSPMPYRGREVYSDQFGSSPAPLDGGCRLMSVDGHELRNRMCSKHGQTWGTRGLGGLQLATLGRNVLPSHSQRYVRRTRRLQAKTQSHHQPFRYSYVFPRPLSPFVRASAEDECVLVHDRLRVEVTVKVKANMQFKKIFEVAEVTCSTPSA
jgi:hypothetical protein